MAMTRDQSRKALATLFEDGLTGDANGNLVVEVSPNLINDPAGKSPLVIVMSAGAKRERIATTFQGSAYRPTYRFGVLIMVAEANSAEGWTEAKVEDRLDAIEEAISEIIIEYEETADWVDLSMNNEFSIINPSLSAEAGIPYVTEERYVYMKMR